MPRITVSVCLLFLSVVFIVNGLSTVQYSLPVQGRIRYNSSDEGPAQCDFLKGPCAPLSDVWGYTNPTTQRHYGIVGLSNGIDVVDVTDPTNPVRVNSWTSGCLTEWRDMKTRGHYVYGITDKTPTCNCFKQPCQDQLHIDSPADFAQFMRFSVGAITSPLPDMITGRLVMAEPPLACRPLINANKIAGNIAVLWRGGLCLLGDKIQAAQKAGATAVVVVGERDDIIYPSMNGNSSGINIPGGLVSKSNGALIRERLQAGQEIVVSMSSTYKINSPIYGPPEGLAILDFADPTNVRLVKKTTQWFNFSHNILIDTEPARPYAYICGMNSYNGGLVILDLTDAENPSLIGSWSTAYFHDVDVRKRNDRYYLFGAAIYDMTVYILDVTDPRNPVTVANFTADEMPHNSQVSQDGNVVFVTHEDTSKSVTVWDVSSFDKITRLGNFNLNPEQGTIPHNAAVMGDRLWMSYYSEGVAVYDISNPRKPVLLAREDTSPLYTEGYHGVWGIFPWRESNTDSIVYASDIEEGFFTLKFHESTLSAAPVPSGKSSGTMIALAVPVCAVAVFIIIAAVVTHFFIRTSRSRRAEYHAAHLITGHMTTAVDDAESDHSPFGKPDNSQEDAFL